MTEPSICQIDAMTEPLEKRFNCCRDCQTDLKTRDKTCTKGEAFTKSIMEFLKYVRKCEFEKISDGLETLTKLLDHLDGSMANINNREATIETRLQKIENFQKDEKQTQDDEPCPKTPT